MTERHTVNVRRLITTDLGEIVIGYINKDKRFVRTTEREMRTFLVNLQTGCHDADCSGGSDCRCWDDS